MKPKILAWVVLGMLGMQSQPALPKALQQDHQQVQAARQRNPNLESLADSVREAIHQKSSDQRWYVNKVDHRSQDLAVLIRDNYNYSRFSFYQPAVQGVLGNVDKLAIELASHSSQEPLRSVLDYHNNYSSVPTKRSLTYQQLLSRNRLYSYLDQHHQKLMGLEDPELLKRASKMNNLQSLVWDIYHDQDKERYLQEQNTRIHWFVRFFSQGTGFEMPEYNQEMWTDQELFQKYWGQLEQLDQKLTDQRVTAMIKNLQRELGPQDNQQRTIGVMLNLDRIDLAQELLDDAGISYLVVGNRYFDQQAVK